MTNKRKDLASMSAHEEWVAAHRGDTGAPDQLGELVRHRDAARQAAASLARRAA